jgi:hypothetical protein
VCFECHRWGLAQSSLQPVVRPGEHGAEVPPRGVAGFSRALWEARGDLIVAAFSAVSPRQARHRRLQRVVLDRGRG